MSLLFKFSNAKIFFFFVYIIWKIRYFIRELILELLLEKNVRFSFSKFVHVISYPKIIKKFECLSYFNFLRVCIHIFRANIRDIEITRMITYDTYINRSKLVEKFQTCNYVEYINSSLLACLYHDFYRILFARWFKRIAVKYEFSFEKGGRRHRKTSRS